MFNNRFRNHTNAYTILEMGTAAQHKSWLDEGGIHYHNAAEYDLDNFDWAEAAEKIASAQMSASQVISDFTPLSATNIQTAIDKFTIEKGKLVPTSLLRRTRVQTVINKLTDLKKNKQDFSIDVNIGSPPTGTTPTVGGTPTWGDIAHLLLPNVNNNNNNTVTTCPDGFELKNGICVKKNNTTKYLLYGGIAVGGLMVIGTIIYFATHNK